MFIELTPECANHKKVLNEIENLCKQKLPLRDKPRKDQNYYLIKKFVTIHGFAVNSNINPMT